MAIVAAKMKVRQFEGVYALQQFLQDAGNNISVIHACYSTNSGGHVLVYEET